MPITFSAESRVFCIETESTGYYIGITDTEGFVTHIHYGKKLCAKDNLQHLLRTDEHPFLPSKNERDRVAFYDSCRFEYSTGGIGDFRESCLNVKNERGQSAVKLSYVSYEIINSKPKLKGLPATTEGDGCQTLIIHCEDKVLSLSVDLYYSIFKGLDSIARSVTITNNSDRTLTLTKVYSACLDIDRADFDFISLNGSWARERHIERTPLLHGKVSVSSLRGETSQQQHSFIALASKNADYSQGEVYALSLVYSGNFISQAEVNQFETTRAVTGINSENFAWKLEAKKSFTAPEAVLVYSDEGLGKMSRTFHDTWRNHLIRGEYINKIRPVLINNWEATYFDFDEKKLLDIAKEAAKNGIEMLVMDDGWFGKRNSDESSLGDWFVNETKLKGGLKPLVEKINSLGLKFGIWFEPEMISPDSDLYRSHPDWALCIQGRKAALSRAQYVLDLTRQEVCDYVYERISSILKSVNIEYVKWDMNRPLTDAGSILLNSENSGELFHRYVLAVYALQEKLVTEFPHLLLENCSAGGARFDAGMLYYSPQIWCSDDTDAIERLLIQEGTALVYPLSAIGAHVSTCPNHACGRTTPFRTRGFVALAGTFGYELDITKISQEDRALIPEQVGLYKKYGTLIQSGDYYRIASYSQNKEWDAWCVIKKDKSEALLTVVHVLNHPNLHGQKVLLRGLDESRHYRVTILDSMGSKSDGGIWSGSTLMNGGLLLNRQQGDFHSHLVHLESI